MIVLQHPHESRRKNRSLPLVELCFQSPVNLSDRHGKNDDDGDGDSCHSNNTIVSDFNVVIGRRFGDQTNEEIMNLVQDPDQDVILFYPSDDAVSLMDGLEIIRQRRFPSPQNTAHQGIDSDYDDRPARKLDGSRIILLFFDATWKYAQEMDRACTENGVYPPHIIRVRLTPTTDCGANPDYNDGDNDRVVFQPRRFDIRAPPTLDHLSTAECIAWALSIVERNVDIYRTLMKPLDLMVQKWHSFAGGKGGGGDCDRLRRLSRSKSDENVPASEKS